MATALIYTGPTNKRQGLRNRAIYRDGELPAHLKKLVEGNSALEHQFVPLDRYAKMPRVRSRGPIVKVLRQAVQVPKLGPPIKKR